MSTYWNNWPQEYWQHHYADHKVKRIIAENTYTDYADALEELDWPGYQYLHTSHYVRDRSSGRYAVENINLWAEARDFKAAVA